MRHIIMLCATLCFLPLSASYAIEKTEKFDDQVHAILAAHYAAYKDVEYFSGVSLSVYKLHQPIRNYYVGNVSRDAKSQPIDATTLFEIGSITKSYTAAIILQLEKENKLHLQDTLQHGLPQYAKWSSLTLESLLNMTSGLPNYTDAPLVNAEEYYHMQKRWAPAELIQFVYPTSTLTPPLKQGYAYTNTGYVLLGMLIEKITEHSFQAEIENRLIKPAQLTNTFYPVPSQQEAVSMRLADGYSYNPYENPELLGKSMKDSDLSWAGAAGAVVSTSEDIIKWVKALLMDHQLLDTAQQRQLMKLVSTKTGQPMPQTTSADPRGFALGVTQIYDPEIGRFWMYEGETEGFRALYMYVPSRGIIISAIFNSAVNSENDHAGELMKKIYRLTLH